MKNPFAENILLNQLDLIFPNLTHLHLARYEDSMYSLFSKLIKLNGRLKLLELNFCYDSKFETFPNYQKSLALISQENKTDLKLQSLFISSTTFLNVESILTNYVDLDSIENLSLHHLLGSGNNASTELVKLFDQMALQMRKLKAFSTDLAPTLGDLTWHLAQDLFSKLDKICLTSIPDALFEICRSDRECALQMKPADMNEYFNIEYSFDFDDFEWLFDDTINLCASTIILDIRQNCFCRSNRNYIEFVLKEIVDRFTENKKLKHLEIRFLRNTAFIQSHSSQCLKVNFFKYFENFEYLRRFNNEISVNACAIKFTF